MRKVEVSIIVPAFNAGEWLRDCVESVLNQSVTELEVIVVDDGSTDQSVTALSRALTDTRLLYRQQENAGAAGARNSGLAMARGRWLCFLDADDLLHPRKLERQLAYHAANPGLRISGSSWVRFYGDQPDQSPEANASELWQPQDPVSWQVRAMQGNLMMQPAAWLIERDLVQQAGGWNRHLSLNDDGEFFARQMLQTGQVGFCRSAVSYYRSGLSGNLSGATGARHMNSAVEALDQIESHLLAVDDSARVRQALSCAWSRLAVSAYPQHPGCSARAIRRAEAMTGFAPDWQGGALGRKLAQWLGWRTARRLQWLTYQMGYQRWGRWQQKRRRSMQVVE